MPSLNSTSTGKEYWRSLDDFASSPGFQKYIENEFPSMLDEVITPGNRRTFLKLMGASLALAGAGLAGCRRWPDEKIAPFAHRPQNYVPGEAQHFASTFELGGVGHGVVVRSYDGRPVKIEGNTQDPVNAGASDHYTQAAILEMYDPDRSRRPVQRNISYEDGRMTIESAVARTIDQFRDAIGVQFADMRRSRGRRTAILSESTSSGAFADMKERLQQAMPEARWYEYEPLSRDNEWLGAQLAFGQPRRTQYDVSNCDVLVCIDSDFLMTHPAAMKHARQWARRRDALDRTMPRMYAVEGMLSVTGANADHTLRVRSRDCALFATMLAKRLGGAGVNVLGANDFSPGGEREGWERFMDALVRDLAEHRGRSIVVAGPRQPAEVHAMVHAINFALQNVGSTVNFTTEPAATRQPHLAAIDALSRAAANREIDHLIIIGGNPVFDAPADVDFAAALEGVSSRVHLSTHDNETSHHCHWHVPMAHWLECWGDARAWDGTLSIRQPLILPLYDGLSSIEMLALMLGDGVDGGYDIVRRWFRERRGGGGDFETAWRTILHDGVMEASAWAFEDVTLDPSRYTDRLAEVINRGANAPSMEVIFAQDYRVYDGRFANNGWLQELPDPIAKICWDNAAFISPHTAEALEVEGNELLHIEVAGSPETEEGRRITLPAHVVPGMADDVIVLNIGYGRIAGGHIATGVGFDVQRIRTIDGFNFAPVRAARQEGGETYELATVQDHHAMATRITEWGKQRRLPKLIQETSLEEYLDHGFESHGHLPPVISLWEAHKYQENYLEGEEINPHWSPNKWGMMIDLNKCTGCSACMIACQAENNIPIVGKQQVMLGREMHWIRVDRYFASPASEFDSHGQATAWDHSRVRGTIFQPLPCQHCETAPCEQVCPVAATVHDRDGLNVMVYNRCVGTRYCSNNCPYKVRRFNFYDWHVEDPRVEMIDGVRPPTMNIPDAAHAEAFEGRNEVKKMMFNPEVTVRSRGVMEKCSYCIQRINKAKIKAKNEFANTPQEQREERSYRIPDGWFTTACAQACPSEAIVFGDLFDPESKVSQVAAAQRSRRYNLLDELNTRPRTQYLGKVRNYNAALENPLASPAASPGSHDSHGSEQH